MIKYKLSYYTDTVTNQKRRPLIRIINSRFPPGQAACRKEQQDVVLWAAVEEKNVREKKEPRRLTWRISHQAASGPSPFSRNINRVLMRQQRGTLTHKGAEVRFRGDRRRSSVDMHRHRLSRGWWIQDSRASWFFFQWQHLQYYLLYPTHFNCQTKQAPLVLKERDVSCEPVRLYGMSPHTLTLPNRLTPKSIQLKVTGFLMWLLLPITIKN